MWKIKGTVRYFISVFAITFVQIGVFIYTQKVIARTASNQAFLWESLVLQGLFLLPYILMIVPASYFSNKFSKQKVLAFSSLFMTLSMIAMAVCTTVGFPKTAYWLTLALAAGFAIHSPAKYGILKEMFGTARLSYANAFLQLVSIAALITASWVMTSAVNWATRTFSDSPSLTDFLSKSIAFPWILTGFSVLATVMSFVIPKIGHEDPFLKMRSAKRTIVSTWSNKNVRATIIGLSMFWAMAQVFVLVFQDSSGVESLSVLKNSLVHTFIGLTIGSFIAAKVSENFIETGLIPLGVLGASFSILLIPFTVNPIVLAILFGLVGLFGGLLLVPLNALLQFNTRPNTSGRIIAVSNMVQTIVLAVFLLVHALLLYYTEMTPHQLFMGLGLIFLVGFTWSIYNMPQALLRSLLKLVFSRYKMHVLGVENIPNDGPVLLVGNHHSFIDWAILQMASPRPLRIASNKDHFEKWYLRAILKRLGMIRISSRDPLPALKQINEALLNGEAVVIFPTGEVSKAPHIVPFTLDFSDAVKNTNAIIVPFYIQGMWGSRYSYSGSDMYDVTTPRAVTMAFGKPIPADTPANEIRTIVRNVSIDAWAYGISFRKPIAASWLRTCKKVVRSGPSIYNPDGGHLSGYKLLCAVLAFSRQLKKIVGKEQNVGIMLPPSPAGIIVNMALWMLGKTNVNLNYTSAPDIVANCVRQADIKTVITSSLFIEKLKNRGNDYSTMGGAECNVVFAENIQSQISKGSLLYYLVLGFILPTFVIEFLFMKRVQLNDIATIMFSSGSEGTPKGVMLSHSNLIGNIQQTSCILNVCRGDVMLCELPLFHSFGLTVTTLLNLIEGCPVVTIADPTDIKTMARACAEFRVTAFVGTPTFLRAFVVNRLVHPMVFKYLRIIIAGAESLRPELQEAFRMKFGKDIFEGYGCTETTPVASVNTENMLLNDFLTMQINNKPGSVGMALPGTRFRIVDPDTNEELPVGEAGMILIGGCQVMTGYLKDPERTAQALIEIDGKRWYRTGDKGYLDEDGFLTIVDRYSRFAKIGGEMVSLGAVEMRIQDTQVLKGFDYAVTSIKDAVKGERLVLLFEGEKDPATILQELRQSGIPPLMIPSQAFVVEHLPKLGTGKMNLKLVKEIAISLTQR
jgi:acyl-[acyl-carrier-protein]-phospholipid O-acyltransferase / long-chain-fatty-acid--[acyl-carrier-protein] ligase